MTDALIGYSGFVGTTLRRQASFGEQYRSADIASIEGREFDTIVCAGAPAQKWIANREPAQDRENIRRLMRHLEKAKCARFVLISTVDVFRHARGVDETSPVPEDGLHAYGLHRRELEKFAAQRFPGALVVRLPGLVGPGLRKNVIYDLLHDNNLDQIDSRSVFQFYPMVNLWYDIQTALRAQLSVVHLTAEPMSVEAVAAEGFGRTFRHALGGDPASYDLCSRHSELFGGRGPYQYSRRETVQAIRAYAQSGKIATQAPAA